MMKSGWMIVLLALFSWAQHASATTVVLGGGDLGRKFGAIVQPGFVLTPSNATIEVGTLQGLSFVPFATTDVSQPTFYSVPQGSSFAGMWTGDAVDLSTAANAFNGQQIWFRVVWDNHPFEAAYLTDFSLFPTNNGGVGDSITINSRDLQIPHGAQYPNTGFSFVDAANDRIVVFAPEPSSVVMGLVGMGVVLRRRRG